MVAGYECPTGFSGAGLDDYQIRSWGDEDYNWSHLPDCEKLLVFSRMNALYSDLFQRRIDPVEPMAAAAFQFLGRVRREWLQELD